MSLKNIFARKELDVLLAEMAGEHRLRRVLGPISLTALGVGAIVGAGIFVLTGMAAAQNAGPAVMVSFAVAAVGCVFAALCYAEFAAMAPVAGSVYAYTYTTLGEIFAWIIGWDLILEYSVGCAAVASVWAGHLKELLLALGLPAVPERFASDPFSVGPSEVQPLFNLPAVLIMAIITGVLVVGIRESARTNAALVLVKLLVVLFVIAVGVSYVTPANWTEIPVSQRILPEEREIASLVNKYAAENAGLELTADDCRQLTAEAAALYRASWESRELERMRKAGRLSDASYQQGRDRLLERRESAAVPSDKHQLVIDDLMPEIEAAGDAKATETWGVLGRALSYCGVNLHRKLIGVDDATRSPFAPYGISGIMIGASLVFFAFIGFDSISTHAEEAKNPQRDVPIGIFFSLAICTVLYIAVAAVVTGMVPYPEIDVKAAIASAFRQKAETQQSTLLGISAAIIAAGALAGMTSVILVLFLSQARVFMAMSRDGLLPRIFGTVHPKWRTPHVATMLTGAVICLVAAFTPIRKLGEMVNIGTLMAFVMVCAAVLILRVRRPEVNRPFRCPMVWLFAPLGILTNLTLMLFLPMDTWVRLVVWLLIGFVIYFGYSRRHSILGIRLLQQLRREGVAPTDAPLESVDG